MIYKFEVTLFNVELLNLAGCSSKDQLYLKFRFDNDAQYIYVNPTKSEPWKWTDFTSTFIYENKFISQLKNGTLSIQCKSKTAYFFKKTLGMAKVNLNILSMGPTNYELDLFDSEQEGSCIGQVKFNLIMKQICTHMEIQLDHFNFSPLLEVLSCLQHIMKTSTDKQKKTILKVEIGYLDNTMNNILWNSKCLLYPLVSPQKREEEKDGNLLLPIHFKLRHNITMDEFEMATIHLKFIIQDSQEIGTAILPLMGNYDALNPKLQVNCPVLFTKKVLQFLPNSNESISITYLLSIKQGLEFAQMKEALYTRNGIQDGHMYVGFKCLEQEEFNSTSIQYYCPVRPALTYSIEKRNLTSIYELKNDFFQRPMNSELKSRGYQNVRRRLSIQKEKEIKEKLKYFPQEEEREKENIQQLELSLPFSTSSSKGGDSLPSLNYLLQLAETGALEDQSTRAQEFRGLLNFAYNLHLEWENELDKLNQERIEFEYTHSQQSTFLKGETTEDKTFLLRKERIEFITKQSSQRRMKQRLYEIGLQVLRRRLYFLFHNNSTISSS